MRALATEFRTSLRVVCDAMTRTALEWRELLDDVMPRQFITERPVVTRKVHQQTSATLKQTVYDEADLDPELDGDPSPDSFDD